MKSTYFLLVVFIYVEVDVCSGEIYSSVAHIEGSVAAARRLTEELMVLARRNNKYIPNIKRFVNLHQDCAFPVCICNYSRPLLSRLRLSRITAYLEEKI